MPAKFRFGMWRFACAFTLGIPPGVDSDPDFLRAAISHRILAPLSRTRHRHEFFFPTQIGACIETITRPLRVTQEKWSYVPEHLDRRLKKERWSRWTEQNPKLANVGWPVRLKVRRTGDDPIDGATQVLDCMQHSESAEEFERDIEMWLKLPEDKREG